MGNLDDPVDPPVRWVRDHVRQYVESDGRHGHRWRGVTTLLLTTTGRRSGRARRTALIYGRDAERYVVVASKGGSDQPPQWYLNLAAEPLVRLQVGAERFDAEARTATGDERDRLWTLMSGIWPDYDKYRARTNREIAVVVLEPRGEG